MAKKRSYWQERFELLLDSQFHKSETYLLDLEEQYRIAVVAIEKDIAVWYARFAKNNEVSLAEAKQMLRGAELAEFHWDVKKYIEYGEKNALDGKWMKQLENASARVHISRLESIKLQTQQTIEELYGKQFEGVERLMKEVYQDTYYHTAFEVQKGFNLGYTLQVINPSQLQQVISKPWLADGPTFSSNIWKAKNDLIRTLHTELTQSIIRGDAPDKVIKTITKKFKTSKDRAGRLVMTESAFFASAAQQVAYKELDVERYEIVATLDGKTSALCGDLDGKVLKMSDYVVGSTAPPFHPWCRTVTVPYFDDNYGTRVARGIDGEAYHVPSDMTYKEWYQKHMVEKHGEEKITTIKKQHKNESTDRNQHERYKKVLGKDAPKSFAGFQEVKYNNTETYNDLKRKYKDGTKKDHLQEQFGYVFNGEQLFIPSNTQFQNTKVIAGGDTGKALRIKDKLAERYSGSPEEWAKKVGKIESDTYIFDLHWYELDNKQYEMKLKHRGEKK